ncbi:hypothetical protein DFH07DRAFT_967058 [Mycena maculata]|uniref:Uncharacterized protein n=1 Tax=Mycena maculata TaxID=230809 RepID=A0AAD7I7V7_9AGAR|nr:hypothetical protein DFH07DRAFT_967058 [Mycena maculata]
MSKRRWSPIWKVLFQHVLLIRTPLADCIGVTLAFITTSMTSNWLKADSARDSPSPESKGDAPPLDSSPSVARRINYQMVGGIHIPNEEGVRWYERKYGRELPKDHRGDMSVRMELERILTEEEGEPLGVEYAPRCDAHWYDFLAATQLARGVWEHYNPDGIDEVFLPEQQMKGESAREDQMRETLCKLGLQPGEFKCYYL